MKMKVVKVMTLLVAIAGLSGCAALTGAWGSRSYLSVAEGKGGETVGTLFVWAPDVSAAVLYKSGETCMQRAMAIKTSEAKAQANLSGAILGLSQGVVKAAEKSDVSNDSSVNAISAAIAQTATLLSTSTERTAFLDTGLFYLCQLAANKSISQGDFQAIANQLVTSAAGLSPATPDVRPAR